MMNYSGSAQLKENSLEGCRTEMKYECVYKAPGDLSNIQILILSFSMGPEILHFEQALR